MISTSRAEYVDILEHIGPIYISLDALSKMNRIFEMEIIVIIISGA